MADQTRASGPAPAVTPRPTALVGWLIGLALAAGLLVLVSGPPPLPRALPSWAALVAAASAPSLPGDRLPLGLLLAGLSWVLWGLYAVLALSVAVSLAEALVERFIPALAPLMGRLARLLALPVVRQTVRASLAVSLVVAPLPSAAAAQPGPGPAPAPMVRTAEAQPARSDPGWSAEPAGARQTEQRDSVSSVAPAGSAWHTVQAGDTLTAIADWYYDNPLAYARLADDNDLRDPNALAVGQALTIRGAVRTAPLPRSVAPPGPGERLYTVKVKDWLSTIAQDAYGDMHVWPAIRERNWAAIDNPHLILPGQRFVLPVIQGQSPRIGTAPRRVVAPAAPVEPSPPAPPPLVAPATSPAAAAAAAAISPPALIVGAPHPVAAGLAETEQQRPWPPRSEPIAAVAVPASDRGTMAASAAVQGPAPDGASLPAPAPVLAPCAESGPAALVTPIAAPVAASGRGPIATPLGPVAARPVAVRPVTTTPPVTATQAPGDALVAVLGIGGLGLVMSGLAVARYRRRQRLAVGSDRDLPVVMTAPTRPEPDPETGALVRDLAAQTRQRRAGVETDNRVVATARCLDALTQDLQIPYVTVLSLVDRAHWMQFRLVLGAQQPLDLPAIEERLQEVLCSPVEVRLAQQSTTADGAVYGLVVTGSDVAPDKRLAAGLAPPTPLVDVGESQEGRVSVGLAGLASGLLFAGSQARVALESAIFSLAVVYRPEDLGVVLLTDEAFAAAFQEPVALPHLVEGPVAATSPTAPERLAALHAELRRRESQTSTDARLLVLVVDRPAALDGATLRTILRDGPAVGIYGLVALADDLPPDPALLDACQGRIITPVPEADTRARLFNGAPPDSATPPGQAWLVLEEIEPVAIQLYRMAADDRRQILTLLAASRPGPDEDDLGALPAPPLASSASATNGHPAAANGHPAAEPSGAGDDRFVGADMLMPVVLGADTRIIPARGEATGADRAPTFAADAALDLTADGALDLAADGDPALTADAAPDLTADGAPDLMAAPVRSLVLPIATNPAEWTSPPPGWLGIRLLGVPRLVYQDEDLTISGKPLEFILYLAAHRCRLVGAETIVAALWPGEGSFDTLRGRMQAAKSRASEALRTQLARISGATDPRQLPDCILTDRGGYRLNPAVVWVDVAAVTARLERQQHLGDEQAVVLLTELLSLYRPAAGQERGSPGSEAGYPRQLFCAGHGASWCVEYQEVYEGINYQSAVWLAAACARRRQYPQAIAIYRRLRELNPIDERVAEFEMICHALMANRRGVREVMTRLHDALTRELDGESVTPETMALYQGLVSGDVRPDLTTILEQSPRPVYN